MWAIVERDLRRFRRSPTLIIVSIVMPVIQLIVLGYAFGGKVKHLELGVVDQDHHVPAVKLKGMFNAVAANAETFETVPYADQAAAMQDLRMGRLNGVLSIPPHFSRDLLAGHDPRIALIEDNTDQFSSSALSGSLAQLLGDFNLHVVGHGADIRDPAAPRASPEASLSVVEVYPYVPYIQYLLPGTIVLAIFVSAMIGGGIIFIDDKARGLHEGYLVTPVTKFELILGFNLAGVIKAVIAGFVLVTIGSLVAGIPDPLNVLRLARMLVLVALTALTLISMMFLLMVRVSDPLVPRAIFGVLNTVLFFPSGAVYPTNAFPAWMKVITVVDPFTYAVHGFKSLVLKNTSLVAVGADVAFLAGFTVLAMGAATLLFKRSL
ncbi:MAG TPA: ABC transporter permease [Gammaproteobacteria bacterium]|nr:ABC transporter permease [Gammaproteobacteria bacterium]